MRLMLRSGPVLAGALAVGLLAAPAALAGKKLEIPSPLQGTAGTGGMALRWSNIAGETGYLVERRVFETGSFAEIAKTTADVTSYTDLPIDPVSYEYRVRAYRAGHQMLFSGYTNIVVSAVPCE
jgi:hypothetical protein